VRQRLTTCTLAVLWAAIALSMVTGCAAVPPQRLDPERAVIEGPVPNDPDMFQLKHDLVFYESADKEWAAPAGTLTDGASIPQAFLSLTGGQLSSKFRNAAIVHDAYCGRGNEAGASYHRAPWRNVHRIFYDACIACGAGRTKAKLMYAAVYLGGPRWVGGVHTAESDPVAMSRRVETMGVNERRQLGRELRDKRVWIESSEPDLASIEAEMDRLRAGIMR
jgi:hypothetical protein